MLSTHNITDALAVCLTVPVIDPPSFAQTAWDVYASSPSAAAYERYARQKSDEYQSHADSERQRHDAARVGNAYSSAVVELAGLTADLGSAVSRRDAKGMDLFYSARAVHAALIDAPADVLPALIRAGLLS